MAFPQTASEMNMGRRSTIGGVFPIILTPFDDHEAIDWGSLEAEVEYIRSNDVSGIGIGFGSEIQKLSERELLDTVRHVRESSSGLRLMVGVSVPSVLGGLQRAQTVSEAGADIAMMSFPGFSEQRDFMRLLMDVDSRIEVDIVIQDAADLTGVRLPTTWIVTACREIEGVIGVKVETTPTPQKIRELREQLPNVTLLGGGGGLPSYHELRFGADGVVPGPAYLASFSELVDSANESAFERAAATYGRIVPFLTFATQSIDIFHATQKYVMKQRGIIDNAQVRRPGYILTRSDKRHIDEITASLDM